MSLCCVCYEVTVMKAICIKGIGGTILGAVSIWRCRITSIGIPMLKIRRSHECLIFNMGIPIPGKDGFYIEAGPSYTNYTWNRFCYAHDIVCYEMIQCDLPKSNNQLSLFDFSCACDKKPKLWIFPININWLSNKITKVPTSFNRKLSAGGHCMIWTDISTSFPLGSITTK